MANVPMSKEILDVINAVVYYGRFVVSQNYVVPKEGFDHFAEMEKYYHSLPLPEGMSKNRADFERILQIGWYSGKELGRLNNTNYSDLRYVPWKPIEYTEPAKQAAVTAYAGINNFVAGVDVRSGVAWIDGAPYVVCLPAGALRVGREYGKPRNERFWDLVLDIAKEHGVDLHNKEIDSWCQEMKESLEEDPDSGEEYIEKSAGVRSTECCKNGTAFLTGATLRCVGFRPCLVPFDIETMSAIDGPWAGVQDGGLVSFGSLYYGDEALAVPTDCRKADGDTPVWQRRNPVLIGDTSGQHGKEISWMKVGNVLVADRNLLVGISWNDLEKMGIAKVADELQAIVDEAFDVKNIREKNRSGMPLEEKLADAKGRAACLEPCDRLSKDEIGKD